MRFEINKLGIERTRHFGKWNGRSRPTGGVILREGHSGTCWFVLFDDRKSPSYLSKNFVTVIDQEPAPASDGTRPNS